MMKVSRMAASITMVLFAFVALFLGINLPRLLSEQAVKNREYTQSFRDADIHVRALLDNGGKLPADLDDWSRNQRPRLIALQATKIAETCDANFKMPVGDRFVLSFWRGEWFECYSSPSGKSTIPLSTKSLLLAGAWIDLIIYLSVSVFACWLAWRIWPKSKVILATQAVADSRSSTDRVID